MPVDQVRPRSPEREVASSNLAGRALRNPLASGFKCQRANRRRRQVARPNGCLPISADSRRPPGPLLDSSARPATSQRPHVRGVCALAAWQHSQPPSTRHRSSPSTRCGRPRHSEATSGWRRPAGRPLRSWPRPRRSRNQSRMCRHHRGGTPRRGPTTAHGPQPRVDSRADAQAGLLRRYPRRQRSPSDVEGRLVPSITGTRPSNLYSQPRSAHPLICAQRRPAPSHRRGAHRCPTTIAKETDRSRRTRRATQSRPRQTPALLREPVAAARTRRLPCPLRTAGGRPGAARAA
jgi:hypothetical protein